MSTTPADTVLTVTDLRVATTGRHPATIVDGVSLRLGRGEIVGLVGESGSGKSVTATAIAGLLGSTGLTISGGTVELAGVGPLHGLGNRALRAVRGARIGMVFQDPSTYLDPLMTVGRQVGEALRVRGESRSVTRRRVVDLLGRLGLPDPTTIVDRYPHELSGGQRQRVLIAAALVSRPDVLIADEPSTALDVTIQAEILALLDSVRREFGIGILLITHDLGVVAQVCDRVYVMYAGRVVEHRETTALFDDPRHPYTAGLLRSTLSPHTGRGELFSIPGTVPDPRRVPDGCRFHPRCPVALDRCRAELPAPVEVAGGTSACWRTADRDLGEARP